MTELGNTTAMDSRRHMNEAALKQVSGGGRLLAGAGPMWRAETPQAAPATSEPGAVAFERLVRLACKNGDFPGILRYTGAGR